jgi:hypothetical protein
VNTIPRLTNLLLSAERDGNAGSASMLQTELSNLNSEIRALKSRHRGFKKPSKYCSNCKMSNHSKKEYGILHTELNRKPKKNRNVAANNTAVTRTTNCSPVFTHKPTPTGTNFVPD